MPRSLPPHPGYLWRKYRTRLTRMAKRLSDKGENTTEVGEQIAYAEELMAELMNRMEEGGDGELDDMLESAEEGLAGLG